MGVFPTQSFGLLPAAIKIRLCRLDILPLLVVSHIRGIEWQIEWELAFDRLAPFGELSQGSTRVAQGSLHGGGVLAEVTIGTGV